MARRKRKHPHRHTGKLVPLRTAEQIESEVEQGISRPVNLNKWREIVFQIQQCELEYVETDGDRQAYVDRTAVLAECMAWLDQIQQRYLHDKNGNPIDVPHDDATSLANNAIRVGYLMGLAASRVELEAPAMDAYDLAEKGRKQAEKLNKGKLKITRDELLTKCRAAYRRHKCNQKKLAEHVAADLPISPGRVRQLMQELKIHMPDYS